VHANKAVQNTMEQNKVGEKVITGEDISRRRGRLYYDRGETLLRSRGDFRMGETISRDTGSPSAGDGSLNSMNDEEIECLLCADVLVS